jgi:hypothetical protein
MDKNKIDKFMKNWKKADIAWKKAAKKSQQAASGYHWTAADDGAKWNKAIALRDLEGAAFQKAEAARKALIAVLRP